MRLAHPMFLAAAAAALTSVTICVQGAILVGRNDPAFDVPTLQGAASTGGHHLLTGTFDLGETGRVLLTRDVTFEGGAGANGEPAIVRRGDWAFLSPLPFSTQISATVPFALPAITAPGPRIVIRNLVFDGARGAAVHVAYASHLEVTGNTIRNVHRRALTPTFSRHAGIDVGTNTFLLAALRAPGPDPYFHIRATDGRRRQNSFVPGAITGEVTIASNTIQVDPAEDDALDDAEVDPAFIASRSQGYGVYLNLLDGAVVRVADNAVSGAARGGIVGVEPRYGPTGAGSWLIEGNRVVTPRRGAYSPSNAAPNGVEVSWFFDPAGMADSARNVPPLVRGNRVELNGRLEHIPAFGGYPSAARGIGIGSDRAVIERNHVSASHPGHFGIDVLSSFALARANRVDGTGLAALRVATTLIQVTVPDTNPDQFVLTAANGNAFVGNNITGFVSQRVPDYPRASDIAVFSGGAPGTEPRDNVFVGSGGSASAVTVLDLGRNTRITGYAPMTGGAGESVRKVLTEALPIELR